MVPPHVVWRVSRRFLTRAAWASLVVALCGCGSGEPTGPDSALKDEARVQELVLRDLLFSVLAEDAGRTFQTVCVSLYDTRDAGPHDPEATFLGRFADYRLPVKPGSACGWDSQASHTRHWIDLATRADAVGIRVGPISWSAEGRATVEAGYGGADLWAASFTYALTRDRDTWQIRERRAGPVA